MATLRTEDLMTRHPRALEPQDSLLAALQAMKELDVGFMPVCDTGTHRLIGVCTDRDAAMALTTDQRPGELKLADVMTRSPVTCRPGDDLHTCAVRMERAQVRRMPVVDADDRLLGVVSLADLARRAMGRPELEKELSAVVEQVSQPMAQA